MNTTTKVRPWQGTFLGVIGIIGLVLSGLGILLLAAVVLGLGAFMSASDLPMLGALGSGFIGFILMLVFFALGIFITIGIFKGEKWSVIAMAAFTALSILQAIFVQFSIFGLLINGFFAWMEYTCYLDSFYTYDKKPAFLKNAKH